MRGVNVARVVLFVWYQLYAVLLIWNHVTEPVPLSVIRQCGCGQVTLGPFFRDLLVFGEEPLIL